MPRLLEQVPVAGGEAVGFFNKLDGQPVDFIRRDDADFAGQIMAQDVLRLGEDSNDGIG